MAIFGYQTIPGQTRPTKLTKLTNLTTLTTSSDQKNYQEDKYRIRIVYFVLFRFLCMQASLSAGFWSVCIFATIFLLI